MNIYIGNMLSFWAFYPCKFALKTAFFSANSCIIRKYHMSTNQRKFMTKYYNSDRRAFDKEP